MRTSELKAQGHTRYKSEVPGQSFSSKSTVLPAVSKTPENLSFSMKESVKLHNVQLLPYEYRILQF